MRYCLYGYYKFEEGAGVSNLKKIKFLCIKADRRGWSVSYGGDVL